MLKLLNLDASQLLHAFDTGVLKTAVFETTESLDDAGRTTCITLRCASG